MCMSVSMCDVGIHRHSNYLAQPHSLMQVISDEELYVCKSVSVRVCVYVSV